MILYRLILLQMLGNKRSCNTFNGVGSVSMGMTSQRPSWLSWHLRMSLECSSFLLSVPYTIQAKQEKNRGWGSFNWSAIMLSSSTVASNKFLLTGWPRKISSQMLWRKDKGSIPLPWNHPFLRKKALPPWTDIYWDTSQLPGIVLGPVLTDLSHMTLWSRVRTCTTVGKISWTALMTYILDRVF